MPQLKKVNLFKNIEVFLNNWPSVSLVYVLSKFFILFKVSVDIQWFEFNIK